MDNNRIIERLQAALRYETISNLDDSQVNWQKFLEFHQFLKDVFPLTHQNLSLKIIDKASLLYKWKGTEGGLPFAIVAHIDVVPVISETLKDWKYPPFAGLGDELLVYGRGAVDIKNHVMASFEAVEMLLQAGYQPKRDIYLCFSHNEEVGFGPHSGAKKTISYLQKQNVFFEFTLDEGGAVIANSPLGLPGPTAMVGLGEKGIMNIRITLQGEGGHSSVPGNQTTIGDLSRFIVKIQENPLPHRITNTVKSMLLTLGKHKKGLMGTLLRHVDWTKSLVINSLKKNKQTDAMLRTTIAPTMMQAGVAVNVLPDQASVLFNIRLLAGDDENTVLNHFKKVAISLGLEKRISYELNSESVASKETDVNSINCKIIEETLQKIDPKIIFIPYLVTGATDSRDYAMISHETFRFAPFILSQEEVLCMHNVNERISKKGYLFGVEFFKQFIQRQGERVIR